MFAETLISAELFPLKRTDTCENAVVFMNDWGVAELPVVDNNKVLGFVAINEIEDHNSSLRVDELLRSEKQFVVSAHMHIFDLLKIFDQTALSTFAVVNNEDSFIGIVSYHDIIKDLYRNSSLSQPGGIITLEMSARDYSLAELSRIVEYNDIKIINVFINTAKGQENNILVSLKFNSTDLKNVISSLERHGKIIRSVHSVSDVGDSFINRYDWLIKYMNT